LLFVELSGGTGVGADAFGGVGAGTDFAGTGILPSLGAGAELNIEADLGLLKSTLMDAGGGLD
jgi:hypothetical protein